mmetsp:Transcript_17740/g.41281  ORF Transcript_17740/g.41281 Transcript_17740/m.41281 type:complete len:81 (+) Transcript_17740:955-1197(+)
MRVVRFAQQVLGVQASDNAFRQVGRVWNEVQLNGTIIRIDCRQGERVQVAQSDVARLNRWSVRRMCREVAKPAELICRRS